MLDGIFGQAYRLSVINCNNKGDITNTNCFCNFGSYRASAGGIGGSCSESYINGCYNTGKVEVKNNNSTKKDKFYDISQVGGIVGSVDFDSNANIPKVSYCYNKGNISSGFDVNSIGGIVGGISELNKSDACIEKCYNSGNIECSNFMDPDKIKYTGLNNNNIGGIAGASSINILDCYNDGNIIAVNIEGPSSSVGGIIGRICDEKHYIKNCYNAGSVEGIFSKTTYNGGIGRNRWKWK